MYHFGMDYFESLTTVCIKYRYCFSMALGLAIISFPSIIYTHQVSLLFSNLVGFENAQSFTSVLRILGFIIMVPVFLSCLMVNTCKKEIIFILVVALVAPPLAFLTVYFVGVHSCRHFSMLYRRMNYTSLKVFFIDLLPMTLLTYLVAGIVYAYLPATLDWQSKGFAMTLYVLAALTLPNMILVESINRQLRT
jgi:Brp/Blh family beta-carotene 15,15'-monooxygenase